MKTKEQENNQSTAPQKYGYIRISDSTQKIHRQMDYMIELGLTEDHIFVDKQSGKDFNRPAYKKLMRKLRSGDTLYIKELDRLGRSKEEIKDEINKLRTKGVHVRITNIPTTMHDYGDDDWILDMVNNILVEVLAAVAEQERVTNHQRQAEGIAAARARGVRLGRPPVQLPDNFHYYYEKWTHKEISRSEVLKALQIDAVKWSTLVRSYRKQQRKNQCSADESKNSEIN